MSDEQASVREWTDILARIRFGKVEVSGRNIAGGSIKAVAGRLASYADADGSRVRPGLARLAVDLEMDHRTVKSAVAVLRRVGLLELVRAGTRSGHADEYRLAIPVDLLERLEVWGPDRHRAEVERVRDANRGKYKRDLQGQDAPADDSTCRGEAPPQSADLRGPAAPAEPVPPDRPAGARRPQKQPPAGARRQILQGRGAPATLHRPRHNYDPPPIEDVRTAVTDPCASAAVEDPDSADEVDAGDRPLLRLIEGALDDEPLHRAAREGIGFCVPCSVAGQVTVAADPNTGSACGKHLRSAS